MAKVNWVSAKDVKSQVESLVADLDLSYINPKHIYCFRSYGSVSRAYARIWGFPVIWQKALRKKPLYCLEVLSEKYDRLSDSEKRKVLIHELTHIPKNFSGALMPHIRRGKRSFHRRVDSLVDKLVNFGKL